MKTRIASIIAAVTCLVLVSTAPVTIHAGIEPPPCSLVVLTTADSGPDSLRAALACAVNGDTIDATGVSGTITLTTGQLFVTNSVTILGSGLAVSGNATSRVFFVRGGVNVTIVGLTITNGDAENEVGQGGGGILNDHSTLTVSNCTLSGNLAGAARYGGGIFNDGALSGS